VDRVQKLVQQAQKIQENSDDFVKGALALNAAIASFCLGVMPPMAMFGLPHHPLSARNADRFLQWGLVSVLMQLIYSVAASWR
jgi:hypothetical protein